MDFKVQILKRPHMRSLKKADVSAMIDGDISMIKMMLIYTFFEDR